MSWLSDRWGNGPSMSGLKSSIKGTAKTLGKVAAVAPVVDLALDFVPGGGVIKKVGGAIIDKIPGASTILGGGADGKGALGKVGDLLGNKDALLAGAGLYGQFRDDQRVRGLEDKALGYATGAYDEKAPLRAMALSALMKGDQAPDLSGVLPQGTDPYSTRRKAPSASSLGGY